MYEDLSTLVIVLIVWGLFFYFSFKIVRRIISFFSSSSERQYVQKNVLSPFQLMLKSRRREYSSFRPTMKKDMDESEKKGIQGERIVHSKLLQLNLNYIPIHNLYVPKNNGGYSQIDHLLVSQYGIFVIENKCFSGLIFGKEKTKHWKQKLGKNEYFFYNPVKQNKNHIKTLMNFFNSNGLRNISLNSIVVFSGKADVKLDRKPKTAEVVYSAHLLEYIKSFNEIKYSEREINRILHCLNPLATDSFNNRLEKERIHHEQLSRMNKF